MSSDTESDVGDAAQKSQETILEEEIEEGIAELRRPTSGIALSGLSAGLDIGFGPLLMAVVLSHSGPETSALAEQLVVAGAYAIGFIFVVLGQSALFTEHTVLSLLPVLDGQSSLRDLLRMWVTVYVSNIAGCVVFTGLAVLVGPSIDIVEPGAFVAIADVFVRYAWWATLLSAVLAGWLMGLLSWLVVAARDTTSVILVVVFITGAIGFAHLPHSIAGTVEVLLGVFSSPRIGLVDYAGFLLWSTLGNVIGGVFFVGLLKYSHVVRAGPEPEEVSLRGRGP
ncbi:formate/nitrite transporter family protein [Halosimplex aquaticum]|uniref:Formate/nitrite transporter family protein n=1 Tax=Halosimplex aquaticum TaxID=3026162 RepID=A0ABD5Y3Z3_9EURY|nr:formate/nitrite transporter family protein [Halosimplex aquaticum]